MGAVKMQTFVPEVCKKKKKKSLTLHKQFLQIWFLLLVSDGRLLLSQLLNVLFVSKCKLKGQSLPLL